MGGRMRTAVAAGAATGVLGALLALPLSPAAAQGGGQDPQPYKIDPSAKAVKGASSSADGPRLAAGQVYKDSLKAGDEKYYQVKLDSKSTAHVSATAAPKPGSKTGQMDGFSIALTSTAGDECGDQELTFRSENSRVLSGEALRPLPEDIGECNAAGIYYVVVKRQSQGTSDQSAWPLELQLRNEPALKVHKGNKAPDYTDLDEQNPPAPPGGKAKPVTGGLGFTDAGSMGAGVWRDEIVPGETRYYRMPVDWGQQPYSAVEFGNAKSGDSTDDDINKAYDGAMVRMYGPGRASFANESAWFSGIKPTSLTVFGPPVKYENRYDIATDYGPVSIAGWYYVAVTVSPELGGKLKKPVPVTLRNTIKGEPAAAPGYRGDLAAAGFGVSDADREAAETGKSGEAAEESDGKMTIAYVGIGAGVVLLGGLGVWMLVARRKPAAAGAGAASQQQGFGQPQNWQQ
ncbi:hypothetical protein G5C51_08345 [Streptomyces sp. A7024]|uniref:Uncharacterized protein n=1 Tax=Streptomyces coryli TaxID=1128680 RepID=A0A6G4TVS3_9ACTN|nr:hypothetical protein [Streptomyces coryli]NGN63913.1 hypothetical protein [Streptomyces coryli]